MSINYSIQRCGVSAICKKNVERIAELEEQIDLADAVGFRRGVMREQAANASLKEQLKTCRNDTLERAAEKLMHRVGSDPLLHDQTAISALIQEAKAIRKEIT